MSLFFVFGCVRLYLCVIIASAAVAVVLSHYHRRWVSMLSLNSMMSPASQPLELSTWTQRCPVVHPLLSSCHNCTQEPAAILLLNRSPFLQIRPYFTLDTESDAFTWPALLFPLPIILSLTVHCFLCLSLSPFAFYFFF